MLSGLEMAVVNEGERYLPRPEDYQAAMHLGHMATYREALRYSYGRRVLDLGCGTGYGSFFLACYGAANVTAVDIGAVALRYAHQAYCHSRLRYVQTDGERLCFPTHSFDFVFSSQVIEHVQDVTMFLSEIRRVLTPDGFCLITTPNQHLFSPLGQSENPYHCNEMSWEVYRQNTRSFFATTWFRGIPQKCLRVSADGVLTVKPNWEICSTDYVPQDHDLEKCENMLCFGHPRIAASFAPRLPAELSRLADELGPLFWDSHIRQWVVLGLYPGHQLASPMQLSNRRWFVQRFQSPMSHLYRIDIDLAAPATQPVRVILRSKDRQILDETRRVEGSTLTLRCTPMSASAQQWLTLSISPVGQGHLGQRQPPLLLARTLATPTQSAPLVDPRPTPQLALRTFHAHLPAPLFHA